MQPLHTLDDYHRFLHQHPAALLWFTGPDCNVCHALRPKVEQLMREEFPRLALASVDCAAAAELAAQCRVFTIPTALVFFDGRESGRFARSFGLGELRAAIERPYSIFFDET